LIAGAYGITIAPLQHAIEKQGLRLELSRDVAVNSQNNTFSIEKQEIRIEQNSKRIQLGEINAAKREIQMEHLTEALRELNRTLNKMNGGV
tara:strand:- start:205 stop:477 length:273 start_codon:yes stop_codon:yes gene_type:complete